MPRMARAACLCAIGVVLLAGCGGGKKHARRRAPSTIAVDAPFSRDAYIGTTIANGVRLADRAPRRARRGGIVDFKVVTSDNARLAEPAVANIRRAIGQHAVAIVSDGTGVDAAWKIADKAHVPIAVVYDGDENLVDPETRPNVFRIAPTNHGMAFRFAEYLVPEEAEARVPDRRHRLRPGGPRVARPGVLARTPRRSPTGSRSRRARPTSPRRSCRRAARAPPRSSSGASRRRSPRRSSPRAASGWKVPIYAPPSAEDPLVRQELASHPQWLDGLTFAVEPDDRRGRRRAVPELPVRLRDLVRRAEGRREDRRTAGRSSSRRTTRCTRTTSSTCSRPRSTPRSRPTARRCSRR